MIVFAGLDSPVITSKETKSAGQSCSWADTESRQVAARQRLSRELLMVVGRSDMRGYQEQQKRFLLWEASSRKLLRKAAVMRRILNEREVTASVAIVRQSPARALLGVLVYQTPLWKSYLLTHHLSHVTRHTGTMNTNCNLDKIIKFKPFLSL